MAKPHATLIFSRHGESQWNVDNRFTGWVDATWLILQGGKDGDTPLIPSVPLHSSVRHLPLSQVDLSAKGLGEAKSAGSLLKSEGIKVDMAFTSYLKRGWVKGDTKQLLS